jgi:hypothetical protein
MRPRRRPQRASVFVAASLVVILMPNCVAQRPSAPRGHAPARSAPSILTWGATIAEEVPAVDTAPVAPGPSSTVVVFILVLTGDDSPAMVEGVAGGGVRWREVGSVSRAPAAPRRLTVFSATEIRGGPLTISFPRAPRTGVLWAVVELSGPIDSVTPYAWPELRSSAAASSEGSAIPILVGFGVGTASHVSAAPPARSLAQATLAGFSASLAVHWSRSSPVSATWSDPAHTIAIAVPLDQK